MATMVSETKVNGSEGEQSGEVPPALAERPAGLPPGKYALVGWDMDTTGRRLIDEICQIAAYTPKSTYSQYIMPYGDLNPGARRRHNVRVVTVGRYRMLKDTNTHKILKTKSEISALSDFLDWLEKEKGDGSVILIYHEPRRLSPTMLLEALTRYKLLERFKSIVAGFTDSYALAAEKCKSTVKSVSLRVLARVLLDADALAVDSALHRATAAYKIVDHLAQGEQQEVGGGEGEGGAGAQQALVETARRWARPVATELQALADLKTLLERQNTFRPVFAPLLRSARAERKRVTQLRRLLADHGLLYDTLKEAWQQQQLAGLEKQLEALSASAKEEDIKELIEILDCHFDPAKEPKGPKPRQPRNRNRATSSAGETGEAEGSSSSSQSQHSEHSSPAKQSNANGEQQEVGGGEGEGGAGAQQALVETARRWARPVATELQALADLKTLLERQNTFRPVFAPLLRSARAERKRVTQLRRLLADHGLLYDTLKEAWQQQQLAGLEKQLEALSASAKEEDIKELIEILDCHFDPAKEPKGPKPRQPRNRNRATSSAGETGEAEGSSSSSQSQHSEHSSPAKQSNANGEQQEVGGGEGEGGAGAQQALVETARRWARPVATELQALADLKTLLERQNTFRPVFAPLLRSARAERKRVTQLRRLLADHGLLYDTLKEAWQQQQLAGLEKQLEALSASAKEEDIKELIEILDCHFDPAKEPKGPKPRQPRNRNRATSSAGETGEAEGSSSSSQSQHSEHSSPAKQSNANEAVSDNASQNAVKSEPVAAN